MLRIELSPSVYHTEMLTIVTTRAGAAVLLLGIPGGPSPLQVLVYHIAGGCVNPAGTRTRNRRPGALAMIHDQAG